MRFTYVLRMLTVAGTSGLLVLAGTPAQAGHGTPAVRTITTKLSGPFGLDVVSTRHALVAEGDSGQVTAVDLRSGRQRTLLSGLGGPAGVAAHQGRLYVLLGGPSDEGPPKPSKYPPASLLVARPDGSGVRVLADLMKYELKHNPDRQRQFDKAGKPYDALSNPFSVTATKWGLLVADGGANDILRVHPRTGAVATFFVPPNPRTKQCLASGAQANPGVRGCDSVPTGVAVRGRHVYVSTLGADKPGAAAVYQLDGRTGRVLRVWRGFTSLTGVAVSPRGTIYASEVLSGAPAGAPPAGFDASRVGRITRIQHGRVTHARVTMPTGLEFQDGKLYATTWSVASFFGRPGTGRLVMVDDRAFR